MTNAWRQLVRATTALTLSLLAFAAYALLVTPLIEPPTAGATGPTATAPVLRPRDQDRQLARLLATYFPPEHWVHQSKPIVIKNGSMVALFRDCNPPVDGQVRPSPLALVVFPATTENKTRGEETLPRDAIILEAPEALFQLDGNLGLGQSTARRFDWGRLIGPVTIRSDMGEPGPKDDLWIQTSDVQLNEQRVWTSQPVQFALGPNRGRGKKLEIRLLTDDSRGASSQRNSRVAGVLSIEVLQDIVAEFFLDSDLLSAKTGGKTGDAARQESAPNTDSPIELRCDGPFFFHLPRKMAIFESNVEVIQGHQDGPVDQMSCTSLTIHFSVTKRPGSPTGQPAMVSTASNAKTRIAGMGRFRPVSLEAVGAPVLLRMPSRDTHARCEHLTYEIDDRRITLQSADAEHIVELTQLDRFVQARHVSYQLDSQHPRTRLGTLHALGPRSIKFVPDSRRPREQFSAVWPPREEDTPEPEITLQRPEGEMPQLSITGRPTLTMMGWGQLTCDAIRMWLAETPSQQKGRDRWQVLPDRLSAMGAVQLASEQLSGHFAALQLWFKCPQHTDTVATTSTPARAPARPNNHPRRAASKSYHITAALVQAEILLQNPEHTARTSHAADRKKSPGMRASISQLAVLGDVQFRETSADASQPVTFSGQQLHVRHADTDHSVITLSGQSPTSNSSETSSLTSSKPPPVAEMSSGAVRLRGREIVVDRGKSRMWINSPGELRLPIDRDLEGKPLDRVEEVTIQWNRWLDLRGNRVQFEGDVQALGQTYWLRSDRLVATFDRQLDFTAQRRQNIDILALECVGRVVADHLQTDRGGPTAKTHVELARLWIDKSSGDITGDGPGWVRTVRLRDEHTAAANGPRGSSQRSSLRNRSAFRSSSKLEYMRVDFQGDLTGNLRDKELNVSTDVHALYAPVDTWDQVPSVGDSSPSGSQYVRMNCDNLGVAQWTTPGSDRGWHELTATGNVGIEGSARGDSTFYANAGRVTYHGQKEVLVLDGVGKDAKLWQYSAEGTREGEAVARKIEYWRRSDDVKVEDARYFDFVQLAPLPTEPNQ